MKNLVFLVLLSFLFLSCEKETDQNFINNEESGISENLMRAGWPRIIFGTRSKPCGNPPSCYCDGERGICLIIEPRSANAFALSEIDLSSAEGVAEVIPTSSNKIQLNFLVDNSLLSVLNDSEVDPNIFKIYENIFIDNSTLGSSFPEGIIIKKGNYSVDYTTNSLGVVEVDID